VDDRPADPGDDRDAGGGQPAWIERIRSFKVPASWLASKPFRWAAPRVLPQTHRLLLRLSGGRWIVGSTSSQPMCMLHTIGARSGEPRDAPLAAVPIEDDKLLVVGSNFASDRHPAWTANLIAHPDVSITFKGHTFPVTARLLSGQERQERWNMLLGWFPNWRDYTSVTDREFRVFELQPVQD